MITYWRNATCNSTPACRYRGRFSHHGALDSDPHAAIARVDEGAFTLVEVMVVLSLVTMLMITGFGAIVSMDLCSRRQADYIAAMAIVEAKVQDIRAATYKPPNANFRTNSYCITNSDSVSLNQAGITFMVRGTLISEIKPVASGHLITVTGTFLEPRKNLVVSLQTLVNQFSGGQQ